MRNYFATDFPLLSDTFPDNVVTQGHANYCRDHGHATHTVDGVDQGYCPRCGASTTRTIVSDDAGMTTYTRPITTYAPRHDERMTRTDKYGRLVWADDTNERYWDERISDLIAAGMNAPRTGRCDVCHGPDALPMPNHPHVETCDSDTCTTTAYDRLGVE